MITNNTFHETDENTTINVVSFDNDKDLYEYLDDISYALYGCSYNSLHFLDKNPYNFLTSNVLVNDN